MYLDVVGCEASGCPGQKGAEVLEPGQSARQPRLLPPHPVRAAAPRYEPGLLHCSQGGAAGSPGSLNNNLSSSPSQSFLPQLTMRAMKWRWWLGRGPQSEKTSELTSLKSLL